MGCVVFVDILTPCSIFSKSMQADELDTVSALTYLLKTVKEIDKLKKNPISKWEVYSTIVKKVVREDGKHLYQGARIEKIC